MHGKERSEKNFDVDWHLYVYTQLYLQTMRYYYQDNNIPGISLQSDITPPPPFLLKWKPCRNFLVSHGLGSANVLRKIRMYKNAEEQGRS